MIVATAPGRCGIVGNPTDMYGGSVISCTLTERAECVLRPATELLIEADNGEQQTIRTVEDFELRGDRLDLPRAVLRGMGVDPTRQTFHLCTRTDIPMQAGLAGSTALVAVVYGAVGRYLGLQQHRYDVAESIRRIEYEVLGVICGFQDQHMTVFGGLNYMDFRDKGSHLAPDQQPYATVEPLAGVVPMPLPLVLANTGVKHHSGAAHKPVRLRWLEGDPQVRAGYERIQQLARYGKKALLAGDWTQLAELMNENQQIQVDLGASGEACDRLAAAARANGAMAAKLAGAGQGGTILALTFEPERTIAGLQEAGAARILIPAPSPGLTVEVKD